MELSLHITDDEHLARYVFSPRHIDPLTHQLKANFIFLRPGENDISFVRYDKAGHEYVVTKGNTLLRNQSLYALALGLTGDLRGISKSITITADNENNPLHASLRIIKDGGAVKGIVTDAYVQDLFEQILEQLHIMEL